ncbi:uncharacterized protein [Spinacia oleracea]|uniref:Reverse transcriptase zinc-binding domain-containing protein n=1 Tax=Spinacia oleracea TaxID=3562 RepID=A0ABM3QYC4_SPIOL|nr:uncharacterized protein LOC130463310 [Spinacia oleracea]
MCSKGDFPSVYLMLQAFKIFSDSTGLLANKQKSTIYYYGMSESDSTRVVNVSGFTRSNLPFKYLGVPICAKRISATQCDVLVDRMISRIKVWSSRNFSYTARMQLINSVLLTLHISCCDKKYGGLGFRDVFNWNTASMGKCVWAIASQQDNVWIKWVNAVYVKDGDWIGKGYALQKRCSNWCTLRQKKIIGAKPLIHWDSMVWNRMNIPKHIFICWLAVQGRLQTTAKLARIGVCASATCLLCGQFDEDHAHLFFDCPYSKRCIMALNDWLSISSISCNLHQLLRVTGHSRLTKFRKQVVLQS